mmetsp:Transcript_10788/g.19052  ORF Transcript_10788/g.19052 Transcript_10788/m.19052 type:complete len:133 (-) Transcript_10788:99-497(-)
MTEVYSNNRDHVFGHSEGMVGSARADNIKGSLALAIVSLEGRLRSICAVCPDFLLGTVLIGMLGEPLRELEGSDDLDTVVEALRACPNKSDGFRLGLNVVESCCVEGIATFLDRLERMSVEQLGEFRALANQ